MRQLTAAILMAISILPAAGCAKKTPGGEVIAKIGSYTLYGEDVRSELSLYPPEYLARIPKEQLLDDIIQKKVLLLEAERQGLDKDPEFMKMVEHFWEQSLLRSLLDRKSKEILAAIPESEPDRNSKAAAMMKSWMDGLIKGTGVEVNRGAFEKMDIK